MNTVQAVEVVARHLIYRAVNEGLGFEHLGWEDYPDVGEQDWVDVATRARQLAERQYPMAADFAKAYRILKARADGVEAS